MLKKEITKSSRAVLLILLLFSLKVSDAVADGLFPDEQPLQKAAPEPPKEEILPETEPLPEEKAAAPAPAPAPVPPPAPMIKPRVKTDAPVDFWSAFSKGTILSGPKPAGTVLASKDPKTMFALGDVVYLISSGEDLAPQTEWVVFRKLRKVHHPKTGKYLGDLIDLVGMVKVVENNKKVATAEVVKSKGPIFTNDEIASIESLFNMNTAGRPLLEKEATIVEVWDHRFNSGEHDIVYLDRGREDGVVAGDRFEVIHPGRIVDASMGEMIHLPERKIGNLVILSTQAHTSTAQILKSVEPVSIGDPLLYISKGK